MSCTGTFRLSLLAMLITVAFALLPAEDFETVRTSNAAILNRLGLVPLPNPDTSNHHRKRLAALGETNNRFAARLHHQSFGRRHDSNNNNNNNNNNNHNNNDNNNNNAHDSHIYVVKLPASPPYYSFSKPHKQIDDKANVTVAKPNPGFKNNGKPAKIYHWNLPLVKKIKEKKKQMALMKIEQARKKFEADRERQKLEEKMNYLKKLAQEQLVQTEGASTAAAGSTSNSMRKPSRNNDKWLSDPEMVEPRTKNSDVATQMKILTLKSAVAASSANKIYRLNDDNGEESTQQRSHHFNNWHHNDLGGQRNNGLDANQSTTRSKKHKKKSAGVSYYYAPVAAMSHSGKSASTSISKHFSGNGKPKAFYVMEKSRKPAYYHPLMP